MLYPLRWWRHLLVLLAVITSPVLVLLSIMGGDRPPPVIQQRQVAVIPDGTGLRVRDVIDVDFGAAATDEFRRDARYPDGTLPGLAVFELGSVPPALLDPRTVDARPADLVATLDGAPVDSSVDKVGFSVTLAAGEPFRFLTGPHRYVLEFRFPLVTSVDGQMEFEVTGGRQELVQEQVELVLAGLTLDGPTCAFTQGSAPCSVVLDGDRRRVAVADLPADSDVIVRGLLTGTGDAAFPPLPPRPEERPRLNRVRHATIVGLTGLLLAAGLLSSMWRIGRNLVGGTSAADMAFPASTGSARLVSDRALNAMAATEFRPPPGIEPWQGALLLRERVDATTVSGWFADLLAREYLELRDGDASLVLGRRFGDAAPDTRDRVLGLLGASGSLSLRERQPMLRLLWRQIEEMQAGWSMGSGWWASCPPTRPNSGWALTRPYVLIASAVVALFWATSGRGSLLGAFLLSIALVGVTATMAYRVLLPRRSVKGSALALQVESFRRFLVAGEGEHVDWARQHGLLREYSAWAVALGAAEPWGKAIAGVAVRPGAVEVFTDPLHVARHLRFWQGGGVAEPFGSD